MCLVLFAFSTCMVKGTLFGMVDVAYAKPLNKSKTVAPISACQYSHDQRTSTVVQAQARKQIEPIGDAEGQYGAICADKVFGKYSKNCSGNSPPKYILYKRLKLDVA